MEALIKSVIPAKLVLECFNRGAGIHLDLKRGFIESKWIPAFAGMTIYGLNQSFHMCIATADPAIAPA